MEIVTAHGFSPYTPGLIRKSYDCWQKQSVVTKTSLRCDSQHVTVMTVINIAINNKKNKLKNVKDADNSSEFPFLDSDTVSLAGASSL